MIGGMELQDRKDAIFMRINKVIDWHLVQTEIIIWITLSNASIHTFCLYNDIHNNSFSFFSLLQSHEIHGLETYTQYLVSLQVFNPEGPGPATTVLVMTDEGGKYTRSICLLLLLKGHYYCIGNPYNSHFRNFIHSVEDNNELITKLTQQF